MADGRATPPPAGRTIAGSLLRSAATTAVLLVLYYDAPLDRPLDGATGLLFLVALGLVGVVVAVQLRGILRSRQPRLRAIRAVAVTLPTLWVVFASAYWVVAAEQSGAFTEPLNRTDGLYFTITVFATVGFGDIAPVSQLARVLVTVQMLVGLVTVGVLAKVVLGAVHTAVARREAEDVPAAEELPDRS
ncbi:potassium channel family protein [Trujillonella endophytica]|uniref:Ion channel n=1 Tax=Trujillonella endophytica TaxID=673521 RepID=A0A1H8QP20_9ACTN|nr:potassium channel family protein [Trujillella endophytica]SEO55970.1 Ion channel [Trujillella endophytica]